MSRALRFAIACALAPLPPKLHRLLGRLLLGWQVDSTAYVGHSVIAARKVVLAPHSAIGHFNVIKGLEELTLGEHAVVGWMNWISSPSLDSGAFEHSPNRLPALRLGRYGVVTTRHILDCSDTITLEDYALIAGYRSTVLTHSVKQVENRQFTAPVTLHERATVWTTCILLAGVSIASRTVVSAGSVVNRPLTEELTLYRGNPAVAVRSLDASLGLFHRTGHTS
jgi:acetyltransferase-like isoleucine patch superfamily enzyme